jgi:NTE family protein
VKFYENFLLISLITLLKIKMVEYMNNFVIIYVNSGGRDMKYDLVFEGGGAKGGAFAGALRAFERNGHSVGRVIGTSAGSIVAVLVAANYGADGCLKALQEKLPDGRSVFASFMDTPTIDVDDQMSDGLRNWLITEVDNPSIHNSIEPFVDKIIDGILGKDFFRHVLSLLIWGGWFAGDAFLAWLKARLDQDGRNLSGSNLREFYQSTNCDFSVVAADTTAKEMLILNHRTAPDCPTIWAVRMSMGAPFAWPEVRWKPEWGIYRGRSLEDHRVVDGGLLSNFPIDLFVSSDENIDEIMGSNSSSTNVIGLLIDETIIAPGIDGPLKGPASSSKGLLENLDLLQESIWRIQGLTDTVLGGHDRTALAAYQDLVCHLPAKYVGTLDFDMPPERTKALVEAGDAAMEVFLKGKA